MVESATVKDARTLFPNNSCRFLVLGAGLGRLLYAVRMVEAGIAPEDIRIIDTGRLRWNLVLEQISRIDV